MYIYIVYYYSNGFDPLQKHIQQWLIRKAWQTHTRLKATDLFPPYPYHYALSRD